MSELEQLVTHLKNLLEEEKRQINEHVIKRELLMMIIWDAEGCLDREQAKK